MEATLNSRNQVTLPKQVRDFLNLKAGDRCKFFIQPDGTVVILPTTSITKLKGMLPKLDYILTIEEMEAAIAEGATARHRRSSRITSTSSTAPASSDS